MADSDALRAKRARRHKAGDHSLCKHPPVAQSPPEGQEGSPPLAAVIDPMQELRELAARLVAAHEADPGNALLARELRMTLQALTGGGKPADDDLESLFAELSAS